MRWYGRVKIVKMVKEEIRQTLLVGRIWWNVALMWKRWRIGNRCRAKIGVAVPICLGQKRMWKRILYTRIFSMYSNENSVRKEVCWSFSGSLRAHPKRTPMIIIIIIIRFKLSGIRNRKWIITVRPAQESTVARRRARGPAKGQVRGADIQGWWFAENEQFAGGEREESVHRREPGSGGSLRASIVRRVDRKYTDLRVVTISKKSSRFLHTIDFKTCIVAHFCLLVKVRSRSEGQVVLGQYAHGLATAKKKPPISLVSDRYLCCRPSPLFSVFP